MTTFCDCYAPELTVNEFVPVGAPGNVMDYQVCQRCWLPVQGTQTTHVEEDERTEEAWWAWHDADQSRWSQSPEEAEARCAAWVAGESDDGPEF